MVINHLMHNTHHNLNNGFISICRELAENTSAYILSLSHVDIFYLTLPYLTLPYPSFASSFVASPLLSCFLFVLFSLTSFHPIKSVGLSSSYLVSSSILCLLCLSSSHLSSGLLVSPHLFFFFFFLSLIYFISSSVSSLHFLILSPLLILSHLISFQLLYSLLWTNLHLLFFPHLFSSFVWSISPSLVLYPM